MSFKFGSPAASSASSAASSASSAASSASSASQNSYSGSFVSTVSISASDSVSNVGSMLSSVQLNPPVVYSGGAAVEDYVIPRYFGSETTHLNFLRYDYATFRQEIKTPLTFVSGSVIKCHHANGQLGDFVSEAHMQYLHVIDDTLICPKVKDSPMAEKVKVVTALNKYIFEEYEMVSTNWGSARFYRAFKDMVMKPVVDDLYNGTLPSVFFKKSMEAPDEPLSVAVFEYWLAK
jgi:hypothetical protein